jgi:hypothetical protein
MQADNDDTDMLGRGTDTIQQAVYDGEKTRLRVKDVPGSSLFGGNDWDKDDAFNGGFIEIHDESRLVYVEDFDSRLGDDDVFVFLDYSSALGKTYWLGDDDYKRGPDEKMQMKITYPHPADISKARDALLPAYVWVEDPYDGTASAIDFQRNVSGDDAIDDIIETDWNLHEDGTHVNRFWNIHLVSCHQEDAEHDLDPFETEEDIALGRSQVARVTVFVETIRDANTSEDAAVLHEIGHGLGAKDIAGISDPSKGIMCEELPRGGPYYYHFADQSLAEIRDTKHTE